MHPLVSSPVQGGASNQPGISVDAHRWLEEGIQHETAAIDTGRYLVLVPGPHNDVVGHQGDGKSGH
jgi:hypothetical protein